MERGVCKSGLRLDCGDVFAVRRVGRTEECSLGEYIALHCTSPDRIEECGVNGGRGKQATTPRYATPMCYAATPC